VDRDRTHSVVAVRTECRAGLSVDRGYAAHEHTTNGTQRGAGKGAARCTVYARASKTRPPTRTLQQQTQHDSVQSKIRLDTKQRMRAVDEALRLNG
jgi:hypothetical protein